MGMSLQVGHIHKFGDVGMSLVGTDGRMVVVTCSPN